MYVAVRGLRGEADRDRLIVRSVAGPARPRLGREVRGDAREPDEAPQPEGAGPAVVHPDREETWDDLAVTWIAVYA